jgi:uncharacterized protein (DUF924 family)
MGEAQDVLHFWFDALEPEQHWAKDDMLDARIADRFGPLRDRLLASGAEGWDGDAARILAAVIVLDQFSRNIHRDTRAAFAADPFALDLALTAIAAGWDRDLPADRRAFLYMPLMHAEDRGVARFSLRCFAALGDAEQMGFARDHAAVIARFGRYPSRNAALGRESTAEERAYLASGDAGW